MNLHNHVCKTFILCFQGAKWQPGPLQTRWETFVRKSLSSAVSHRWMEPLHGDDDGDGDGDGDGGGDGDGDDDA